MKHPLRRYRLPMTLIGLASVMYLTDMLLTRDTAAVTQSFVLSLAFLPIYYLITTFVMESILTRHEREEKIRKLSMVVGAFFSETGYELLARLTALSGVRDTLVATLGVDGTWQDRHYDAAVLAVRDLDFCLSGTAPQLADLKNWMTLQRRTLLSLMENPNLLEHETFTDLVLATNHLAEELYHRETLVSLPRTDLEHLSGDMARAYRFLILEWLAYLRHLKTEYPYLYSLAIRTHPFLEKSRVVIAG